MLYRFHRARPFQTSKTLRWETDARRCHIDWVLLDSDWEGEIPRVAESHSRVRAYALPRVMSWARTATLTS